MESSESKQTGLGGPKFTGEGHNQEQREKNIRQHSRGSAELAQCPVC